MLTPATALQAARNRWASHPAAPRTRRLALTALALRSVLLSTVALLIFVATAQSCPTPPSSKWSGTFTFTGPAGPAVGTWEAPFVEVHPETLMNPGEFELTGVVNSTSTLFPGTLNLPEVTTGEIVKGTGFVNCMGEAKFTTESNGTISGEPYHFDDRYEETATDTEVSGIVEETSPAIDDGTYSGNTFPALASVGSSHGTVELVNPAGTNATSFSVVSAAGVSLPPGSVELVGALSFEIDNVPAAPNNTIDVTLTLPPGSNPTEVYKSNGTEYELYPLSKTTVDSSDEITLALTDNELPWDENPSVGVIADPVIPAHRSLPTAETNAASAISAKTASLHATVKPNGGTVSECKFEWGKTNSYGKTKPCSSLPGSGSNPVGVSASITGLVPGSIFHYRISATNPSGTSKGSDKTFKTPNPELGIETKPASAITQASAILNATVGPDEGEEVTECEFEYGTTSFYGQSVPCSSLPVLGEGPVPVSASLTGLSANTSYHFRISGDTAGDPGEPSVGSDETFTTLPNLTLAASFDADFDTPGGEYQVLGGSEPVSITQGRDGNLWYTGAATDRIGKVTTSGKVTEYPLPEGSEPWGITQGPDGDLWFTDVSGRVGKITTSGTVTEYPLPGGGQPYGITRGPDGNLWYANANPNAIGKITTSGTVTEYPLPEGSQPARITQGADGNLWFTDPGTGRIGKITTSGAVTEYPLPEGSQPYGITLGSDGNLWFTDAGTGKVGKITTSGKVTEYGLPGGGQPYVITQGPDGNLWYTDATTDKIGKITTSGVITEYPLPAGSNPYGITEGPGGDIWYTSYATSKIGEISVGGSVTAPSAVALDPSGNIWVTDSGNLFRKIVEFNSKREYVRHFGSLGTGPGQFCGEIGGIATNASQDVFVSDSCGNRVEEFNDEGTFVGAFGSYGTGNGQLHHPGAIAVDPAGNVWVLDADNYRVEEFSEHGEHNYEYKSKFGEEGSGPEQLGADSVASTLAFSEAPLSEGHLYVAERYGGVKEFSTSGALVGQFDAKGTGNGKSSTYSQLYGIASDPATGDLYITESGSILQGAAINRVQEFSAEGSFIAAFGSSGVLQDQFAGPRGIAVNSSGTAYVVNSYTKQIEEWVLP